MTAAAAIAYTAWVIPTLPETIPTHYGISGHPSAYGSRDMLWLLDAGMLPLIALLWLASRLPLERMNTGVRVTDENRARVSAAMQQLIGSFALFMSAIVFWVVWVIATSAAAGAWSGSIAQLAVALAVPFALVAIYYAQIFAARPE
jgi:uncharacterized membrane protein